MGGFNLGSLFSGLGSFFSGQAMEQGYEDAAKFYKEAARIAKVEGALKGVAIQRNIWQTAGTARANVGAGGIALTGSAKDAIHSNMQQGYLTKAINVLQTKLEVQSYLAQAAQMQAMADAAQSQGMFGLIGGILGMFSDDRLKEDITLVGRRGDGIGVYTFRYQGGEQRFEGVLASEIAVLRPEAIMEIGGYRAVDYASLGMEMRAV